jgi:hypothetical protein
MVVRTPTFSVEVARRLGGVQPQQILRNLITAPSAPQRRLRDILLRSRPPILEEEGKIRHSTIWATAAKGRGKIHFFDTSHFALETYAKEIAAVIRDFFAGEFGVFITVRWEIRHLTTELPMPVSAQRHRSQPQPA